MSWSLCDPSFPSLTLLPSVMSPVHPYGSCCPQSPSLFPTAQGWQGRTGQKPIFGRSFEEVSPSPCAPT